MVAIIIILYNPSEINISQLKQLIHTSSHDFVLVDNSLISHTNFFHSFSNVHYIPLYENTGIANAQNVAIEYIEHKIKKNKFVLFLDQDSKLVSSFINEMCETFEVIHSLDSNIGILLPTIINERTNNKQTTLSTIPFTEVTFGISSGMLTTIDVIKKTGLMNAEMFIDYVDFEWCWRAKTNNYKIYQALDKYLVHNVGEKDKYFFKYHYILSSPIRYYYQYRNYIYLIGKNYVPLKWKLNNFLKKILFLLIIPFSEKNALYLKYMFKGIFDGFRKLLKQI